MTERNDLSRYKRRNKRRNNNIQIFLFGGLAAVVFIVLLLYLSSDDKNDDQLANEQETENTEEQVDIEEPKEAVDEDPDKKENEEKDQTKDEEREENEQVSKQDTYADRETYAEEVTLQRLTTTDKNVEEAYIADWPAIGTKQTGKHTVTYEDGSDDRVEIKKAISYVTELNEDNIIEHWIGNGGDDKVIATISDKEMENHYKVYLSWVKDEGWKPTKLEYLTAAKTENNEQEVNENKAVEVNIEDKQNNEG